MMEFRPGFISLQRETGKRAWIRVDEISAIIENETKVGKDPTLVPCLTIYMRNNVAWHFVIAFDDLREMIQAAGATQMHVIDHETLHK